MMMIRGRATLYGEYLMHDEGGIGYCFPVPFGLARGGQAGGCRSLDYDAEHDSVAAALRSHSLLRNGWEPAKHISGCLPLGFGFAGSTVLALVHLDGYFTGETLRRLVLESDSVAHGFTPSGVDFASIRSAGPILYSVREVLKAPPVPLAFGFVLPAKERTRNLSSVRAQVASEKPVLSRICVQLSQEMMTGGGSVLDGVYEYSGILQRLGIYSSAQEELIKGALCRGVAAKGIGGLYDKAIMFVGSEDKVVKELDLAKGRGAVEVCRAREDVVGGRGAAQCAMQSHPVVGAPAATLGSVQWPR